MRKQQCFLFIILLTRFIQPAMAQSNLDLQGHRGCRGLMPENTMPAFLKAVELGVTTLEMDLVVSSDGQLVVSHEPWMSPVICSHPDGKPVTKAEAKGINLYKMKYEEIQSYECGLRLHPGYPNQQKIKAVKPTLKMVVRSVERFASENKYNQPLYNLEIKSAAKGYDIYTPKPSVFVGMVVEEIRRLGIEDDVTLQSFDINVLEELNKVSGRRFDIAYLVEKGKKLQKNLGKLTFKPDIYSPHYKLLSEVVIKQLHDAEITVIPWTVNTKQEIDQLILWGVDGVITDYPDLVLLK